jgi:hypothetical protein
MPQNYRMHLAACGPLTLGLRLMGSHAAGDAGRSTDSELITARKEQTKEKGERKRSPEPVRKLALVN